MVLAGMLVRALQDIKHGRMGQKLIKWYQFERRCNKARWLCWCLSLETNGDYGAHFWF